MFRSWFYLPQNKWRINRPPRPSDFSHNWVEIFLESYFPWWAHNICICITQFRNSEGVRWTSKRSALIPRNGEVILEWNRRGKGHRKTSWVLCSDDQRHLNVAKSRTAHRNQSPRQDACLVSSSTSLLQTTSYSESTLSETLMSLGTDLTDEIAVLWLISQLLNRGPRSFRY